MKIVHIIDSGGFYGAEVMLLNLIQAQKALGLEPALVSIGTRGCPPKPLEARAADLDIDLFVVRMRAGLNIAGAHLLFQLAAKQKATLLHSHGYKGNILLGLLPLFWRKIPLVTTLHGWTWTGGLNRMMLYEWLDAISLRFIDHVVLVNGKMEEHRRLKALPSERRSIVNNGIDIALDNRHGLLEPIEEFIRQRPTVVAVGRFSREKNFSLLVDAVAELVREGLDLQLLLLGDGYLRGDLEARIKTLDMSARALLPGYVKNIPSYLKRCQVFAMPSLTEGLPMALLEAMAVGIPIVASRVGGIPDALDGGKAGVLIEVGDREGLKGALRGIYQAPEARQEPVALAKKRVESEFSSRKMAENYLKIYQRVLARKQAV